MEVLWVLFQRYFPDIPGVEFFVWCVLCGVLGWAVDWFTRRVGGLSTLEGLFFACFIARQLSKLVSPASYPLSWLGFWAGLIFCTLERFSIGTVFHALPVYREAHEAYHGRLRQRKGHPGTRHTPDDVAEIAAYLLLFWGLYALVWDQGFWVAVSLEHLLGFLLRTVVQYVPTLTLEQHLQAAASSWSHTLLWRSLLNADSFYWYHIVVHPKRCMGFSSTFWDLLAGSCPPCAGLSLPLPFLDFLTRHDLHSRHREAIAQGWAQALANPRAFHRHMLQLHTRTPDQVPTSSQ